MKIKVPDGKILLYMPVYMGDDDGLQITAECLKTLKQYTKDYFLVIAHNDADPIDGTLLKIEANYYFRYHNPDSTFNSTLGLAIIYNSVPWGVCIHNDVFFTPNWLDFVKEQMARPMVGVSSLAFSLGKDPRTTKDWLELNRVAGCCWAIKAELIEKVGWWEERGGMAGDADYWIRCIRAGYECHINHRTFVYHKSFVAYKKIYSGKGLQEKIKKSYEYFSKKWKGQETYGYDFGLK